MKKRVIERILNSLVWTHHTHTKTDSILKYVETMLNYLLLLNLAVIYK